MKNFKKYFECVKEEIKKNPIKFLCGILKFIFGVFCIWLTIYLYNKLPNATVDNFLFYILGIVLSGSISVAFLVCFFEYIYNKFIFNSKFYQRLKDKYGYLLNDEDDNELYSKK